MGKIVATKLREGFIFFHPRQSSKKTLEKSQAWSIRILAVFWAQIELTEDQGRPINEGRAEGTSDLKKNGFFGY